MGFNKHDLTDKISCMNQQLKEAGHDIRFVSSGENGRQVVNAWSVTIDGDEFSTIQYQVCCGSPRECSEKAWAKMHQLLHEHYKDLYEKFVHKKGGHNVQIH